VARVRLFFISRICEHDAASFMWGDQRDDGQEKTAEGSRADPPVALASALSDLLVHHSKEYNVYVRPHDGFAHIEDVLATPFMQKAIDAVIPGQAASLAAGGKPSVELLDAIRAVAKEKSESGQPLIELYDEPGEDMWIKGHAEKKAWRYLS